MRAFFIIKKLSAFVGRLPGWHLTNCAGNQFVHAARRSASPLIASPIAGIFPVTRRVFAGCFAGLLIGLPVRAQTNLPVKLAIVPESAAAATAVDLLTAEFSKNDQVLMLERAEIDKVYREQSLSAGHRDYLKLGQILGADGLLLGKGVNP